MEIFEEIDSMIFLSWIWRVVAALLILGIGRIAARLVSRAIAKVMRRRGLDEMLTGFLSAIVYVLLFIAVVIAAVGQLGITTTPLVAILGAAGLAVGLALQGSLGHLASGVMLVLFRPFKCGDFVDAGGVMGTVKEVGLFQTVLRTPDNRKIVVPNAQITNASITNFSAFDTRRVDLIISVHYDDDLKVARNTIKKALDAHEKVLEEPAPVVMLMELGESSVDFAVRPWVKSSDFWAVRGELMEQIKDGLEAAGCSIPFPQRDVHVIDSSNFAKRAA